MTKGMLESVITVMFRYTQQDVSNILLILLGDSYRSSPTHTR